MAVEPHRDAATPFGPDPHREPGPTSRPVAVRHHRQGLRRPRLGIATLSVVLAASCVVSLALGSAPVPVSDVVRVLAGHLGLDTSLPGTSETIVWLLRAPRVLCGALVGAVLAASGAALQAIVRNTLADPFLLGVSSGASLGAAAVLTMGAGSVLGVLGVTGGAFAGALLSIVLVLVLVRSGGQLSSNRLVLAGLCVSFFLGAMTNLLVVVSDSRDAVRAVLFWMLGSLNQTDWRSVPTIAVIAVAAVAALTLRGRRLDALALGDDVARSLGTDPDRFRAEVVLVTSLAVAAAVSISGSIGFVGLVVPHLARRVVGAGHHRLVPASALTGAIILVWADALARTVLAPRDLPLGVLTALLGTPLLMVLVRRQLSRPEPG